MLKVTWGGNKVDKTASYFINNHSTPLSCWNRSAKCRQTKYTAVKSEKSHTINALVTLMN